jgi:hypothetical protein
MELLVVVTSSAARGRGEIIFDWYVYKVILSIMVSWALVRRDSNVSHPKCWNLDHGGYAAGVVVTFCHISCSSPLDPLQLACKVLGIRVPDGGAIFKAWSHD